jgi:hypothetical protein
MGLVNGNDLKRCSHPLLFEQRIMIQSWTALLMEPRVLIKCMDKSTLHVTSILAYLNSLALGVQSVHACIAWYGTTCMHAVVSTYNTLKAWDPS